MLDQSAPQLPSSHHPPWRGSAAASLGESRYVRPETRGSTESVTLGNTPEASEHLLKLLETTDKLMNEVQTIMRRIGDELEQLGLPPWTLPNSSRPPACPELDSLSPRESEILELFREGHRVSTIARSLCISPHTVRNHLQSVYRKVGVNSQAGLIEKLKGAARPSFLPGESLRCA